MTDNAPSVLWRADKAICDYASPVVCGEHAYFANKANVLHCLDITTGDANGDGVLENDEIPNVLRAMLPRIDTDGDGKLSGEEMDAMAKSFTERRKNSAASARDPIVYGAAAADGRLAIRTGTHLYVVSGPN